MLTHEKIESLSALTTPDWPTISLYLRIDKERIEDDFTIRFKNLLGDGADNLDGSLSSEQRDAVLSDMEKIRIFIRDQQKQYGEGLALFANSHADIWEVISLPAQIESGMTIAPTLNVAPLIRLLDQLEPFATCMIARDQSRLFYGNMERFQVFSESHADDVPGKHQQGGWSQARYERHVEEHVRARYKETAEQLLRFVQERPCRFLVLAGPDEVVAGFLTFLHPYVRERYIGSTNLLMEANINDVHRESCAVVRNRLREEAQHAIESLLNTSTVGGLGVTGLHATIDALNQQQLMTLIVADSFETPGAICR